MGGPIVREEDESLAIGSLACLAAKVLSDLKSENFASAAYNVSELQVGIYRQMVERYDPRDPDGFANLVAFFSTLFNDKREAAVVFGISVSTFYRWKSGETVPHVLMRGTIRETILRYMIEKMFDDLEPDGLVTSH